MFQEYKMEGQYANLLLNLYNNPLTDQDLLTTPLSKPTEHTAPHMALEGVTSLGEMTVKTKGCVITWGP